MPKNDGLLDFRGQSIAIWKTVAGSFLKFTAENLFGLLPNKHSSVKYMEG